VREAFGELMGRGVSLKGAFWGSTSFDRLRMLLGRLLCASVGHKPEAGVGIESPSGRQVSGRE